MFGPPEPADRCVCRVRAPPRAGLSLAGNLSAFSDRGLPLPLRPYDSPVALGPER